MEINCRCFSTLRNKCSISCGTASFKYSKRNVKAVEHRQNELQVPFYAHEYYYFCWWKLKIV
jgi:hypothetical protein